ncbi:MAG: ferrochelatase [Thermoplasmatota archaeon]
MKPGVLLMTFGAVERVEDVAQYYTNIRGGRAPPEEKVADLRRRYERIGGSSPLVGITRRQAAGLEAALRTAGHDIPVEIGMRFWSPSIEDGVRALAAKGVRRVVGITSGPYDSRISVAGYERFLREAVARVDPALEVDLVRQWFEMPGLDAAWEEQYRAARAKTGWPEGSFHTLLTCHALPERIMVWNDPYPRQFLRHAARLARHLGLRDWGLSYQSAGLTEEPWLGPDILGALEHVKNLGAKRVMVLPIGFCADHLEILHDLDIEACAKAESLGLGWARAPSLNASPTFLGGLATVVLEMEARRALPAEAPFTAG